MHDFSDLTVVIPTLNEEKNIQKLMGLLVRRYRGLSIIVSDDGSSDGTKHTVLSASKRNKNIRFLDRKSKSIHGLTASVIDAAMLAKTDKLVVMDADMQHPYEKVGEIADALDSNDLVIGVRTSVKNWGVGRRIVSIVMTSFAYTVFSLRGIPTCKDMMSGLFGIKTQLFKSTIINNKKAFVYEGYKVLLDTLRVINRKVRITEVKYSTFAERKYGKSKLSMLGINHASDTLKSILR